MSAPAARVPPWYETETVYGPFHRKTKNGVDPRHLFEKMAASGELWGQGRTNSPHPAALAFYGRLPAGASGIEFFTRLEPDRPWGTEASWFSPPHGEAQQVGDWAKIDILIRTASKDCI